MVVVCAVCQTEVETMQEFKEHVDKEHSKLNFVGAVIAEKIKNQEKDFYKELMIEKGDIIETKYGPLQTIKSRGNAWICALCDKTPYLDPMETKQDKGIHDEGCVGDEYYDDCSCNKENTPFALFSDNYDWEITLHISCAEKKGILDHIIMNHKK